MSDGVVVADKTGKFLLWNPAAERFLRRPGAEIPQAQWAEYYGCYQLDGVTPYPVEHMPLSRAIRGEEVDEAELFIRHKQLPKGIILSINARPLRDKEGAVCGGVIVFRDVTARKKVEEELRKSRERFELAVQGSQDGLWDWDLTTGEVYYSPRYKAMLGYADDEFPNRSEEWTSRLHPDDMDRVGAELRVEADGRESLSWLEFRLRHKDGSYRWIRSRAFIMRDAAGRIYRKAGSHEDITERKKAEEELARERHLLHTLKERYRSVIAAMQDGIVILDPDGSIRDCNAAAERILGLSAAQMMGRTPHDPRWHAIHEDGSPFPGDTHPPMITLHTGRPCMNVVMGVHKPDGTLTWISINSQPLFQADGRTLAGVVASFEDISERKAIEEKLRRVQAKCGSQDNS